MTTPHAALPKFKVFFDETAWWLYVPYSCRLNRERGLYHRRTFSEIVLLMDFYLGRAHIPRELRADD